MSFTVEINETVYNLEIETSISTKISTLEIESSFIDKVEVQSDFVANIIFPNDIIGLDNYLSNFIDTYEIDCGSP